jgi:hypothetical protein
MPVPALCTPNFEGNSNQYDQGMYLRCVHQTSKEIQTSMIRVKGKIINIFGSSNVSQVAKDYMQ